jgi:hypothetical protein
MRHSLCTPIGVAPYSIDVICACLVSCSDSTPPRVTPTKNITANNTAITQHSNHAIISWRTKSSHLLVQKFPVVSVHFYVPNFCRCRTQRNKTQQNGRRSLIVGNISAFLNFRLKDKHLINWASENRCQSVAWRSPVLVLVVQPHVDRCDAQRPLCLSAASPLTLPAIDQTQTAK